MDIKEIEYGKGKDGVYTDPLREEDDNGNQTNSDALCI